MSQRSTASGTVSSSSLYEAYGKAVTYPGTSSDVFQWNGRWGYYYDGSTGLHLAQHRFYDASQGRWLNRDPIGYAGGASLYGYCGGAPIGRVDRNGFFWLELEEGAAAVWDLGEGIGEAGEGGDLLEEIVEPPELVDIVPGVGGGGAGASVGGLSSGEQAAMMQAAIDADGAAGGFPRGNYVYRIPVTDPDGWGGGLPYNGRTVDLMDTFDRHIGTGLITEDQVAGIDVTDVGDFGCQRYYEQYNIMKDGLVRTGSIANRINGIAEKYWGDWGLGP